MALPLSVILGTPPKMVRPLGMLCAVGATTYTHVVLTTKSCCSWSAHSGSFEPAHSDSEDLQGSLLLASNFVECPLCSPRLSNSAPAEDPFHSAGPSTRKTKQGGDLGGIMGTMTTPHPRGSLFDDDENVGAQDEGIEADAMSQSRGSFIASGVVESPPQHVVS